MDLLTADPARERSVGELAAACGVASRTLQKHFKRFLGRTPREVLRDLRLERVRHELLRTWPVTSVTESATRWGISHLGRFAADYSRRYGETPSATSRRRRQAIDCQEPAPTILLPTLDRPVIHVGRFDLMGKAASWTATIADEIAASLLHNRWLAVGTLAYARYQLHGRVRDDGGRRLQAMAVLRDRTTGRHLWANRWDGEVDDVFAFEERIASGVAMAVERSLRLAEVERVRGKDPAELGAWDLTMRALLLRCGSRPPPRRGRSNSSSGRWSSRRGMRCRWRSRPGAMATAAATSSPRIPRLRGKGLPSSRCARPSSMPVTRKWRRCWGRLAH